jgi:bifunctional DNase/RNase
MDIEVKIVGVVPDPESKQQLLVLKSQEKEGEGVLPIWIGNTEADSIREALAQTLPPGRPLTHDLLNNILGYFRVSLQKVVIYKLVQGTFFARLHFKNSEKEWVVDSRPSDAVSLAVRMNAPLFVEETVYVKSRVPIDEKKALIRLQNDLYQSDSF